MKFALNKDRSVTFQQEFPFVVRDLGYVKYLTVRDMLEIEASIRKVKSELEEQEEF